ncbi:hypothetical protein TNCV_3864561 [Trichonephila clavipes]|nr:hypothetical protein TNCV_3864561 [Trichonephila clavipes]
MVSWRVTRQFGLFDCFVRRSWDSGSERCQLHEDYAQDALDRSVVEKIATSKEIHTYSQLLHRPPSRHR